MDIPARRLGGEPEGGADGETVFRRFLDEVLNGGDVAAVDQVVAADYAARDAPAAVPCRDALKRRLAERRAGCMARGDVGTYLLDAVAADGERVAARGHWAGTVGGEPRFVPWCAFAIVRGGRIAELDFLIAD